MAYYNASVVETIKSLEPVVNDFTVSPLTIEKGGTVFVSWDVTEISTIDLIVTYASGSTESLYSLDATGTISLLIDENCSIKISNSSYPSITQSQTVLTKLSNMVQMFDETGFKVQSKNDFFAEALLVNKIVRQAAEAITKYQIVYLNGGKVSVAKNDNTDCAGYVLGVAMNDGNIDDPITIATFDILVDNNWLWTTNANLYLAADGTITETPPTIGVEQQIGLALQRNMILVRIEEPIIIEA